MRIAIIAFGSRGDVQPYIALGKGLAKAGHEVRLLTHEDFEVLARSHGVAFWPARGNVQSVVDNEEIRALLEKGNFIALTARTAKEARRAALHWAEDGLAACAGMELIIAGIGGLFVGAALAEKLGLPLLQAYLAPFTPTRDFPSVLLAQSLSKLGATFNWMSHYLTQQAIWQGARSGDRAARQQVLGLQSAPFWGPFHREALRTTPILYGFSPSVIPKPGDWGEKVHVTGYWFLDEPLDWEAPPKLVEFLQGDPKPLCIGFGSMSSRNPEKTAEVVLEALERTQQRAVLLSGWGGLRKDDLPETVFMAESIPHSWLFPRISAVVHHGGAGTTAAGFQAGVPSIIIPFFADQPFWGQRAAALGVGTAPIPRKQLTVDLLAQAIQQGVTDQAMRRRAAQLGSRIRSEDGIGESVRVIGMMRH
jgi:UDP:flavonoid glycosyltransferase YjiC (YdhE family)